MTPQRRANFQRLLKPRHIAFIGGRDATIAVREARRRGFQGQMWAVNPKRTDLDGVHCVPAIADLPEVPDAVYLAIPAGGVVTALRELAQMGVRGVVCFSAGFKETGDTRAEQALIEATGDMALIGPNCYGLINYIDNAALWSFEHGGWSPGYGAAIITQSGMFSSDITMSARSLPLAYMVSAGNQAVLGLEDFLDAFSENPAVRAIGLHIEGLQDIPAFERAALKAIERGVAVVALKTGSSAIGAALTVSHTGSLSGSDELYEALFARTGVISVTSPAQFLETLKFLCVVGAPAGARVAGFTCSGGGATMLADHAEKIGLSFPEVGTEGHTALSDLLPDIATVSNPLDYTTPIWGQPEHTYPVFSTALTTINADAAVLVQDYPAPGLDASKIYYENDAGAFAQAAQEQGIPAAICATLPENTSEETRMRLISLGVAPMQGIHETLNAMRDAAVWSDRRRRIADARPAPLLAGIASDAPHMLTEDAGKAWLSSRGGSIPNGRSVTAKEAKNAAQQIGFPVALKMMSPNLAHKTEAGAVALGINDDRALDVALTQMKRTVAEYDAHAVTDSFLVEAMSPTPLAEMIVTLRSDPQFGPALVLGSGGVLTELVGDAVTLLLPATPDDIAQALNSLRAARLLNGFRGRAPADVDKLADALHHLCEIFIQDRQSVAEIEINPMFIYPDHIVAVDALIHVTSL
ncbi:acetate--CoA ligase family protein [Aestuariivita sp.]|jgi:acyl-CoA synthetase (NDP forming)|uniref:acetate--CoA ligase family protein n=1 Tax=Aestuariivita sp. TaxID=1872407 RepID=UPI002170E2E0|nr:acetate--CoA ligase family protein [Aestuariivita sp.]MCE8007016.1 acetate--CoA ligase family protein [Aestuariivita sp.]